MEKLGAIALSSDILEKADISLWAFELDEGSEPRMNGYDVTRAIRNLPDPYASSIPIVAMTANAEEEF